MVQKIKAKKSNKSGRSDNRPKDKSSPVKDTSVQAVFKELNDPLYKKGYVQPEDMCELHVVSRNWLRNFRRAAKSTAPVEFAVINSDLLASNVYQFESRHAAGADGLILKNNLALDEDYEVVTDDAWGLLATLCESIAIKKTFYVNQDYEFSDVDDSLFVNVVFIDQNADTHKVMLSMAKPRRLENYYADVLQHFKASKEQVGFMLFDTRKSITEFDAAQKNGVLLAKPIDTNVYFPYFKLKDHDVLIVCTEPSLYSCNTNLDENEGGYCYNCRDCTNLYFHCNCGIVSYCCIECKYSDYLHHRVFCDNVDNHVADVHTDLKNFSKPELNDGMVGLRNIGNSCYLNCLLQALKHNELIRTHLASRDPQFINGHAPLTNAIYHLFFALWHSKRPFIRPWFLKIALGLKHKDYLYFEQNDAHECLMNIIDYVHEVSDPLYKAVAESFKGRLASKIVCASCAKTIEKHESFYSLSLPLVEEKHKIKVTVSVAGDLDRLRLVPVEFAVTGQTTLLDKFVSQRGGVLYLCDQERIVCLVDDAQSDLTKVLEEAKQGKNQECYLIYQALDNTDTSVYLGVSFTETKPTATKFLDIKSKICRMRLFPAEASSHPVPQIQGQDVKAAILKNMLLLLNHDGSYVKELEHLSSPSSALRHAVASKLLGQELILTALKKPVCPKKYMFKADPGKTDVVVGNIDPKNEESNYDKQAYDEALQTYEDSVKSQLQLEQEQAQAVETAESVQTLPADLQLDVFYVNRAEICQNCSKKMKHQCKIKPEQVLHFGSGKLIEINVEFPKGSALTALIKDKTKSEAEVKPLSLSNRKPQLSLQSCLDDFFRPERIDFKCEACSSQSSVIQTQIDVFPDNLIIQFKRFATVFQDNKVKQVKNEQFVDFELDLPLPGHSYSLAAVVNHKGEISHGHYTAIALNDAAGGWVLYDDEEVRRLTGPQQIKSPENYILFYRLNRPETDP